ncbi:MAG: PAS domain S-box protein [Chlorobiaceae bacterium]|nr:PAS domain S-box protein [Chlorobiaceae bacterium]
MYEEHENSIWTHTEPDSTVHLAEDSSCACHKTFTEVFPQSMYLVDGDGRIVRWSPWFRDRIAGQSDEVLASIRFIDLVHPDDRELAAQRMRNILEHKVEETVELRILLKGGPAYRWFLLTGSRYERDGHYYIVGTGIDITTLKKAGQALMMSEQRFRSIFEQGEAPVFITDTAGAIMYMSPAFEKMSNSTFAECKGQPFHRFLEGDEVDKAVSMINEIGSNPSVIRTHEFRLRKNDGLVIYVELKLQRYHDNRIEGMIGLLYDLTQRKRLEALTSFRLNLLEHAENSSAEALLQSALDEAEKQTDSSFGFIHILSSEHGSLPQRIWSGRVRDSMRIMGEKGIHHPFDVMPILNEAVQIKRPVVINDYSSAVSPAFPSNHPMLKNSLVVPVIEAGRVVAAFLVGNKRSPYHDDDVHWVGTMADLVWDIVARKLAEQSETRVQSLLLQIQKMELVGQLAGGIAHDFNNMLGVILGNTEIALSNEDLDESLQSNLQEIYKAAERSAEMTSQLLAFARKQTAVPKVLCIDKAVEESLAILQRMSGKEISLDWYPCGSNCMVSIDPSQLDQILMNLCINARDAMNGVGRISITASLVHIDAKSGDSEAFRMTGDYIMISVVDTGHGIPEEHMPHIFEPFFTTKELGKGTGLGLSTVYGIVKQNRGFVEFESKEGKGSNFQVFLPLYKSETREANSGKTGASSQGSGASILVVEDEPEILNLCRLMLEKSGFKVMTAASPDEAIRIAEEWSGKIDLLLTDVVMPGMNGSDLSIKLLKISPGLRILFMSGYTADIIASHGVLDPAVNFIRKPFTIKALAGKVREALDMK